MEEKNLYFFIVIVLILIILLILAVLLLFSVSQKRILGEVSKAQAREIEFAEKLLKNSIETQENERTRIARDLHDGVTSKLNVINLNLNLLKSKIDIEEQTIFEDIKYSINESINLSREISHNLIPPSFSKFGIQSAIEDICIKVNRSSDIKINLEIEHDWSSLEKMQLLHIFRIFQELVNNTIKHSKGSKIQFKSYIDNDFIKMRYSDNGIGLKREDKKEDGIGTKNIKARLKLLSATETSDNLLKETGYIFIFKVPINSNIHDTTKNI